MFLLYPVAVILDYAFAIICLLFINWWAPFLAYRGVVSDRGVDHIGYRLPEWLAWVDTYDGDLDSGLAPGEIGSTWTRIKWLYRNHGYGFTYWVLGVKFDPIKWKVKSYRDDGDLTFFAVGPNGTFNLHVTRFGIRLKLGWKAWNYFLVETETWDDKPWGPEMRVPVTFSISLAK